MRGVMSCKLTIGAAFVVVVAAVYFAGSTELPLPEGISKVNRAEGRIKNCEIKEPSGGKHGGKLFVGMQLDDPEIPYLRWNPENYSAVAIKDFCERSANVQVLFEAQRLVLRPKVSYWIKDINVETNS